MRISRFWKISGKQIFVNFVNFFLIREIPKNKFPQKFISQEFFSPFKASEKGTLKVENFACTNFRDRNFRENLFSRISRIWKNFAKFAKICFRETFQNYEIREIFHKNSLIWKMNNSYMHQCIKKTFLQGFDYRLCLWRQI